ncbi:ATP-dependent RNA helicase RhlB [Gilvimarinus sp. HB14]|uniref:ATP-dependent RNA helicase RhlB n=2 Tax=Gilvimarinus xylanilyticus TaxID=2944139 RepID=A0A9X2I1K2_9GAMM|nr:ATP-dependent RNA helicase RhlB [Gilvimarinus xylanilyticus]MCP8897862.1 ATP-dependent RNA helicase RhlB [Gilvimarinus xylanilyticus]
MMGGDEAPKAQESKNSHKSDARSGGGKKNQGTGKSARNDKAAKSANTKSEGKKSPQKKGGGKKKHPNQANAEKPNNSDNKKLKSDKPKKNKSNKPKKSAPKAPWDISQFPVPEIEGKTRFHDLGLENDLMHAIADLGFEYCSPIQAQSLPYALRGRDVVGKAQTGTGKTAAFLAAIIDDLLKHKLTEERYAGEARALVIAPTRELVMQISDDAKALCKHTDLQIHTLVGGMDYSKQQRRLHDTLVDILVATPGRLLDFCRNKDVFLDQLEILVIDEADRMLDMGFIPQVRQIVRQTPKREERQTLFFSATFTDEVHRLVEQWTNDPVTVEIQPDSVATDTVTQHIYLASTDEKYTLLYNLIQDAEVESLIVFANRRDECRDLEDKLKRHGIPVGLLSGEIAQNKRVSTLKAFKSGELKVLVATDVAGRGIHIDGISHVVNFTLPEEPEDYVHRIGRTGRAGKSGTSISFACEDDAFRLMPIEELLGRQLKCEQPPQELLLETPPMAAPQRKPRDAQRNRRGGGHRRSGNRSGQRRS